MKEYFDICIKEANLAFEENEVPIGACIIYNNEVISFAHNTKNKTNDSTNHAEILCIKDASNKLNNWRLINCDLYVTLFPCPMCISAARQARIRNIYYICDNLNKDYQDIGDKIANIDDINPVINITKVNNEEYEKLLKKFYAKRR